MAIVLAASAAILFGALAVAIRIALEDVPDPESGSLVTTVAACAVCVSVAAAPGDFSGFAWRDTWPFAVAGLVAPGLSQMLFTRAVGMIGASRTAILVGISPVVSAALAIGLLDEPLRVALVGGTVLIVGGGLLLAWERSVPGGLRSIGALLGALAALLFAVRDNVVRWADTGSAVPGATAAAVSLAAASLVILVAVAAQGETVSRARRAARPFLLSGLLYGGGYACLLEAFDRGRVTVVTPLYATESLWAVLLSALVLRRAEAIGPRLLAAALLVVAGGALIGGFR